VVVSPENGATHRFIKTWRGTPDNSVGSWGQRRPELATLASGFQTGTAGAAPS